MGISLDGPPELNDRVRVHRSGRGSFAMIYRGMDLLREGDVEFSVLMVIDEEALEIGPDRIFDFLVSSGVKSASFLAAKPLNQPGAAAGTPTAHYIDPARMNAFLSSMYDRWIRVGPDSIHIREFDSLHAMIRGDGARTCTLLGSCIGQYFLVEPDGTIAHCDLFDGDTRYTLGSIVREDFAAIRVTQKLDRRGQIGRRTAIGCRLVQSLRYAEAGALTKTICPSATISLTRPDAAVYGNSLSTYVRNPQRIEANDQPQTAKVARGSDLTGVYLGTSAAQKRGTQRASDGSDARVLPSFGKRPVSARLHRFGRSGERLLTKPLRTSRRVMEPEPGPICDIE